MRKSPSNQLKNSLQCVLFTALTGVFSALIITAFKILAEWVVHLSAFIYGAVRDNPAFLPLLILGAVAIGVIASVGRAKSQSCRGGGIPTSVAAIHGIISFKWLVSLLLLPVSALLTFLAGLPLGTEGPCVQMGTAIGDGVINCFGKKNGYGWRRYLMTGGASAGFSIATASPVTAIVFAMEELHKSCSPILILVASLCVTFAQTTTHILATFGIGSVALFHATTLPAIPVWLFFAPLIIGLVCSVCSIAFTKAYQLIDRLTRFLLKKLTAWIIFPALFALIALVGFFLAESLGTGHSLVNALVNGRTAWYILILVFLIRALFMILSNTAGVSGGVFLPTLAFGAIIGALCGEVFLALGWIETSHYSLMVVLGITAFLGATSRIPLTACFFAVEALGAINNILPVVIATTVAYIVVEVSGLEDFTDTVINAKIRKIAKEKSATEIVAPLCVAPNSFVVGKNMRDILWPNDCHIIAFDHAENNKNSTEIAQGDIITVRYSTYDTTATAREIEALVGEQTQSVKDIINP